jgi:hypothetical protein
VTPRPPLAALVTALATAFALSAPRSARAAPLDPDGNDWEGLAQLVAMARAELGARIVVAHDVELGRLTPRDALILVHPTRELAIDDLNVFMEKGGRVVLLDDYGTGDALLARFGVRRVPLPEHPATMLRSNPALAVADAVGSHRAIRDVTRVATNHATGLSDRGLAPLLVVRGQGEPDVLLAVAGVVGRGRLLAVGDASVVMNAMLRFEGNRALSLGLLRYAAESDDDEAGASGPAAGRVILLANDFTLTGRFGESSALAGARRLARSAFEPLRRGASPTSAYVASLAVALGLVAWTSLRAGRTHRKTQPRFVRPAPVASHGGVAGHAAVLAAPGTLRALVMLELKSALEETVAARLGLDRPMTTEDLIARARAETWLSEGDKAALEAELNHLARFEAAHFEKGANGAEGFSRHRTAAGSGDAEVTRTAERVRHLVAEALARRT